MSGEQGSVATRKLVDRTIRDSPKPGTPFTPPTRFIPSNYSSPGSTFGKEEDAVIIELGPRYLTAGLEGESSPQCKLYFDPDSSRRQGDFRNWLPNYGRREDDFETGVRDYELWWSDVTDLDLGLLSDKLERKVREAYNKHLLIDAGNARLVLVLPSLVPHPILETVLQTLFERWKFPTIMLLPSPAMSLVGAGLRTGVVVDIGWEETVITSVHEYRELSSMRSTRAMKSFTKSLAHLLKKIKDKEPEGENLCLNLPFVEEVTAKVGGLACRLLKQKSRSEPNLPDGFDLDWPSNGATRTVQLPTADLLKVLSHSFFGSEHEHHPDDHETPLDQLLFKVLLGLSAENRSLCISRIVFDGAGSTIKHLSSVVLDRLNMLIQRQGWTRVESRKGKGRREGLSELAQPGAQRLDAKYGQPLLSGEDSITERFRLEKAKTDPQRIQGCIREVETLGPWAGASLLVSLKVKSFVEIDRERFLSHGLSGANRKIDVSVVPQQRTGALGTRSRVAERTSWTLAGWG